MNSSLRHHLGWWLLLIILTLLPMTNRNKTKFSIIMRMRSFKHAFDGLKLLIKEEHNFRIHIFISILVISASLILKIERIEWLVILLLIAFVFATEIVNTTIENLANFVSSAHHDEIKKVKDSSAAAVLIYALISVAIGLIIFIPKLL